MTITIDNYEECFYRYCEGELNAQERAEVEAFAVQHPELAEELRLYDPTLKLEDIPLAYPDKDGLLHRETRVVPLWRWVAAACVAAVLVGGVWLMWPDGNRQGEQNMVAQRRQPIPMVTTSQSIPQQQESAKPHTPSNSATTLSTKQAEPSHLDTTPAATPLLGKEEQPTTPFEPNMADIEPMLASAEPVPPQQQEDTLVIEYIDIMLMPSPQSMVEVEQIAYQPTVRDRFMAFRSRVSNTVRDYAYHSYSEARAELRTRIKY